jgi:hypothetical protein
MPSQNRRPDFWICGLQIPNTCRAITTSYYEPPTVRCEREWATLAMTVEYPSTGGRISGLQIPN